MRRHIFGKDAGEDEPVSAKAKKLHGGKGREAAS
jgi:hypothetical protein